MKRSDDLYTKGDYLKKNPTWNVEDSLWKAEAVFRLLQKNNVTPREVIEVGCGAGGILESLAAIEPNIEVLKGYDISPQAIRLAKARESKKIQFFNEDFTSLSVEPTDLLLVLDVIEHVDNFYEFLGKLQPKGKYFIFHIPLDLSCHALLKPHIMFEQRESVGHIHYFSKEMVQWLLKDTGFIVLDWFYTKPVVDINRAQTFNMRWKKIVRNTFFSINKDLTAKLLGKYSMMILATSSAV